ncbi:hypothetical protein [Sphingosinithalassobacter portus]|uniref:hypothetical protein n=1 Tax=Stakelama portus TaxID=2676234 RepID=UPI000D6E91A6|nr:hypothetical protein [Sphingosinithalassobacter portus]
MRQIAKNVTVTMYRRSRRGAESVRVASGPFIIMAYGLAALVRHDPKADIWIEAPGGRMDAEEVHRRLDQWSRVGAQDARTPACEPARRACGSALH